jgi:hypothetical protein
MKRYLIFLLFSLSAQAFHKDFTLINDRAPLEFRHLFESMKYSLKDLQEQIKLVVLCQHINKGLAPLAKDQTLFLLKSETYKTVLEWNHPPSQFQVGSHTIARLQKSLEQNKTIYTPYSQWILRALLSDLETFKEQGLMDLSATQRSSLKGDKALKYQRMQRVLKYSRGWLEQADSLSAKDFNYLTQQVAWRTLERVKERAAMFRRFSSQAIQDNQEMTFNIPEHGMPHNRTKGDGPKEKSKGPMAQNGSSDSLTTTVYSDEQASLGDTKSQEKMQARQLMENLEADKLPPTDDLSGAIDQLSEDIR